MPKNQLKYSKDLDTTYILSSDGKSQIGMMEGDQRNNPLAYEQNVASSQQVQAPLTEHSIPENVAQMGKDFVVGATGQAPLAFIPGAGPAVGAARILGSLGAGYGTDRLLNPQKTRTGSAGDAGVNTALGLIMPWLIEHAGGFKIPGIRTESTSTRVAEPTTSERVSTSQSEGVSKGTSESQRSGTSTTEGQRNGSTSAESKSRSIYSAFEEEAPHTPAMDAIQKEIDRLKGINTDKFNAGAMKQLENAINRNEEALASLKEAGSSSGHIRDTIGSMKSATEGSGTSQTQSSGTSEGSRSGETTRSGTTTSSGTTTPGTSTTSSSSVTTGHSLPERILEAITDMHKHSTRQLTDFQKFLAGFLPAAGKSAAEDLTRK